MEIENLVLSTQCVLMSPQRRPGGNAMHRLDLRRQAIELSADATKYCVGSLQI